LASLTRRSLILSSVATFLASKLPSWAQGAIPGRPQTPSPASAPADTNWLHYANDLGSNRYAPLDQIDAGNFNQLEMIWRFSTDAFGREPDADYMSTPLVVNGRLFATAGSRRDVISLDAGTGELLWMYRKDEGQRGGTRGGPGMGLAYWTDGGQERVLFVTIGYQLISLDAKTGLPDPAFGNAGIVDLRLDDDQTMDLTRGVIGLHAPPLVVRDIAVVGCAPSPAVKGYVRGFDVRTGKRKWIFHTVPRKGEFGYDTWLKPEQTETIGNMGAWAPMSADPELGLVYVPVELPSTDSTGFGRWGNTLFSDSLVALDAETGRRRWHYQTVHHGLWDRDVACPSVLCDLPIDGKIVKALALPSKQAYIYVLNRETGEPIWPIPESPVPQGDVPDEWYSPTQPIPSRPPAFDRQGLHAEDLIDWTPEIAARAQAVAGHYKMGPLFTPPALYKKDGPWGTMVVPGTQGGANWPGGSYDPETHMLYIFSKTVIEVEGIGPSWVDPKKLVNVVFAGTTAFSQDNGGGGFGGHYHSLGFFGRFAHVNDAIDAPIKPRLLSIEGLPIIKPPYGRITAIDLSQGTIAWQTVHGETPDHIKNHPRLKGLDIPRTGQSGILGTLTTRSLVICGDCGLFTDEKGVKGARLRAYDKATGEEKGAVFIPIVTTGAPMTYMHQGKQYIVVALGSSNGASLAAFRLPDAGAQASPQRMDPA
jgi:quinoprotein glucose dehydrogenase